jgi:hypothetical protein
MFALAAAAFFAAASVLQQVAAEAVPAAHALRPRLLVHLFRSPRWLLGKAFDFLALVFQGIALLHGTLLLVQPVLAAGLLLALPASARLAHRRLSRRDHLAALACTAGLALLVVVTHSAGGAARPGAHDWALPAVLAVVLAGTLVLVSPGRPASRRALLLGTSGGIAYGLSGALLKATVDIMGDAGLHRALLSWEPYALLVVVVVAAIVVQSAFQAGPLHASLPALTAVEPVVGAFFAITTFEERLAGGPRAVIVGLAGGALALAATIALARSAADLELVAPPAGI